MGFVSASPVMNLLLMFFFDHNGIVKVKPFSEVGVLTTTKQAQIMGKLSSVTMLLALIAITACNSSPESILRKNTEALLMANLNDASSYEFVAIENLQSLSQSDTLWAHYSFLVKPIVDAKESLFLVQSRRYTDVLLDCASYGDCDSERMAEAKATFVEDSVAFYADYNQAMALLDQIQSEVARQTVVGHKALFKYRANNATGAKELREMTIYSDFDFNLYDQFISIKR